MGTNFYKRRIPTVADIKKLHELVDAFKFKSNGQKRELAEQFPEDSVQNLLDEITREIHIGKRSCGWQFSFDAHREKYYIPSRQNLIEWLKEGPYEIVDEYGSYYTVEEFMKMVDDWNSSPNNKQPSGHPYIGDLGEPEASFWTKKGYIVQDGGRFKLDGLTFSIYEDYC